MASREKKPLAPSKSKQKASSDSGLLSNEIRNKKGRSLPNIEQQQLAREIFDTVATGSQLPVKLLEPLPHRNVIIRNPTKFRVIKRNLIQSKVTKKATNKNIRRIAPDINKKTKRIKQWEESTTIDLNHRLSESQTNGGDNESKGVETTKSAKNNLRTKKTKSAFLKNIAESESEDIEDKEENSAVSSAKSNPKLNRKGKVIESSDSLSKSAKTSKLRNFKKSDSKSGKTRKSIGKDLDCDSNIKGNSNLQKFRKSWRRKSSIDLTIDEVVGKKIRKSILNKSSIDLTIDEVIASMLSDSEADNQQNLSEKIEGKITRSRKMLVDENVASDIEIKKEPDVDDMKSSDGECTETDQGYHYQNAVQLRKRSKLPLGNLIDQGSQRSLRNGKQRQLSDSGISDIELKRSRKLNSDGSLFSDNSIEHISDCNVNMDSCFSNSNYNESQIITSNKEETCLAQDEASKNFDDVEIGSEIENNNNSDRLDRTSEMGPILRSKTKAKVTESETMKDDDAKIEDARVSLKSVEAQEDSRKLNNLDQVKKDSILAKFTDKSKGRRNSLNIDMKKRVNNYNYNTDKSDGNSKSQIDQMIENIKLSIAKSIESKICCPEKGLVLNKNFDVPKTEEIVAPLSTESQKMGLEENNDEDKSTVTKNEIKSENTENSVPKVADTAKEIEKLVMGDIEVVETHSQNIQENKVSGIDKINDIHNACQSTCSIGSNNGTSCGSMEKQEMKNDDTASSASSNNNDNDNASKSIVTTRKPLKINDTNSDNTGNCEIKKLNRTFNKVVSKSDNVEDVLIEDAQKSTDEETISTYTSHKENIISQLSDNTNIRTSQVPALTSSEQTEEEKLTEEHTQIKKAENSETEHLLNTSTVSDEAETLESISREVERLVAEDQSIKSLSNSVNNTIQSKEIFDAKISKKDQCESQNTDKKEASACCDENSKTSESATNNTDTTSNKKHIDKKLANTTEISEVDASCKTVQSAEHPKTSNNHLPTTINCDSNSECSSINPVPMRACTSIEQIDEIGKGNSDQSSDCKESDKLSDNLPIDCDITNLDENVDQKSDHNEAALTKDENKPPDEKSSDEHKPINEENRRVLRTRDKQKKIENRQTSRNRESIDSVKVKPEEVNDQKIQNSNIQNDNVQGFLADETTASENSQKEEDANDSQNTNESNINNLLEPQSRTRRGRDVKKRKEETSHLSSGIKAKRSKRDLRKSDQQNKEETLLDNEVAKINENNRSFLNKYDNFTKGTKNFRGFSEGGRSESEKLDNNSNLRSKSENDITSVSEVNKIEHDEQLSRNLSENHISKESSTADILDSECKTPKTPEISPKDSDEASTSGESSRSMNITPKILETPEDKAKKESILRLLGLETLEKAAERMNHQKARKEQYTGTLKTVIRVQKEKDKRRSRSPLKMVFKQGRGDGEGDSPEFYTIQKEFGTSGLGDSSSGANRKFTTNHRHSCDEDNEETAPKDRQSLVIPEKSSSFSIHPGRLCADVCSYCFGKFGSLDTPMHLAQMKSDERRKKILDIERHLTKDSCLCDACYRHVDRKANTSPTNMQQKPQKQHKQLIVTRCSALECRDTARHHVKRRWLLKLKIALQNQVDIDWESIHISSQHTSLPFCVNHYGKIERFLMCALCKRRLNRNNNSQLANTETDELNQLLGQHGIPVLVMASTFICKLCRYFTQLITKYRDPEDMSTSHKAFFKSYRKRILHFLDIEVLDDEEDDSSQSQTKGKDKQSKGKKSKSVQPKPGCSKSLDETTNSTSEKSTPEPNKKEATNSEIDNEIPTAKITDVQYLGIENAVEKLKKRKMLDMHTYSTDSPASCDDTNEIVEIFTMDKEVTLTKLPKKAKINDITPVVQRLGANPSISVRTLFPGEEEMNLHANVEFTNVREITPQGWEKCATMIQYDRDTKLLWQELQRPYGNQSSFLRHLILLEKYYRSGDLILAPNASRNAINYSTSVQNRLISYEGPEKMDEPIMEPISSEFKNSRLSGGYVVERDRLSMPSASSTKPSTSGTSHSTKVCPSRVLKLNPGVSIIKKPPPNLQRLSLPSTSATNGGVKRKDGHKSATHGGKVFQLNELEFKRLQTLKRQKLTFNDKHSVGLSAASGSSSSPLSFKSATQYQKAQIAAHTQFQKHLRMQQEMLSRRSRGDFEPLICDIRSMANENSPTQNVIHNLNLPKSIQVTTKPSNPIPILPKIPKSLTVIPQTITKPSDK